MEREVIGGIFAGCVFGVFFLWACYKGYSGDLAKLVMRIARLMTRLDPRTRFAVREMEFTRLELPRDTTPKRIEAVLKQG